MNHCEHLFALYLHKPYCPRRSAPCTMACSSRTPAARPWRTSWPQWPPSCVPTPSIYCKTGSNWTRIGSSTGHQPRASLSSRSTSPWTSQIFSPYPSRSLTSVVFTASGLSVSTTCCPALISLFCGISITSTNPPPMWPTGSHPSSPSPWSELASTTWPSIVAIMTSRLPAATCWLVTTWPVSGPCRPPPLKMMWTHALWRLWLALTGLRLHQNIRYEQETETGILWPQDSVPTFNIKTVSLDIEIYIIKTRWSHDHDRLMFIIGIPTRVI